ncbi:MAG: bifunctional methylenetetrahydrofolate dehydrogenase/methenyltetrahydrofolate cyclohydrolase FolD [Firmicutes bacterium]|nr:bifunctional methylenetetrahydrofolate dehydrogenase/methenyltetrahydrofolate cyclohydrolase FolD [Bacillota bacterium]
MTAKLIDGRAMAAEIKEGLKKKVLEMSGKGQNPGLAVVLVGSYPPSQAYVNMKERDAQEVGIASRTIRLPEETAQEELLGIIDGLNQDPQVDGILVQLPLPRHIDEERVIESIDPAKDVDCFHPYNVGRMMIGDSVVVPCTPMGCAVMLDNIGEPVEGKRAVVLGRSNIVGKPMALLLLQKNATVTICHSRTRDLKQVVKEADIVVAAIGVPEMITGDYLKSGCIVIDVGQTKLPDGRMVGDVHYQSASEVAGWITPVPGGVGPMTRAILMRNTVEAAQARRGIR